MLERIVRAPTIALLQTLRTIASTDLVSIRDGATQHARRQKCFSRQAPKGAHTYSTDKPPIVRFLARSGENTKAENAFRSKMEELRHANATHEDLAAFAEKSYLDLMWGQLKKKQDVTAIYTLYDRLRPYFHEFPPSVTVMNVMVRAGAEAGDKTRANYYLAEMRQTWGLRPNLRTYGHMLLLSAKRKDWDTVRDGFQNIKMMKAYPDFDKDYVSAFNRILSEHIAIEGVKRGLIFVRDFIKYHGFTPNAETSNLMLSKLAGLGNILLLRDWLTIALSFDIRPDRFTLSAVKRALCLDDKLSEIPRIWGEIEWVCRDTRRKIRYMLYNQEPKPMRVVPGQRSSEEHQANNIAGGGSAESRSGGPLYPFLNSLWSKKKATRKEQTEWQLSEPLEEQPLPYVSSISDSKIGFRGAGSKPLIVHPRQLAWELQDELMEQPPLIDPWKTDTIELSQRLPVDPWGDIGEVGRAATDCDGRYFQSEQKSLTIEKVSLSQKPRSESFHLGQDCSLEHDPMDNDEEAWLADGSYGFDSFDTITGNGYDEAWSNMAQNPAADWWGVISGGSAPRTSVSRSLNRQRMSSRSDDPREPDISTKSKHRSKEHPNFGDDFHDPNSSDMRLQPGNSDLNNVESDHQGLNFTLQEYPQSHYEDLEYVDPGEELPDDARYLHRNPSHQISHEQRSYENGDDWENVIPMADGSGFGSLLDRSVTESLPTSVNPSSEWWSLASQQSDPQTADETRKRKRKRGADSISQARDFLDQHAVEPLSSQASMPVDAHDATDWKRSRQRLDDSRKDQRQRKRKRKSISDPIFTSRGFLEQHLAPPLPTQSR